MLTLIAAIGLTFVIFAARSPLVKPAQITELKARVADFPVAHARLNAILEHNPAPSVFDFVFITRDMELLIKADQTDFNKTHY